MRYFKIRIGYGTGDDHHVFIDETELELAYFCFLTDTKAIFKNGPVRGKDIVSITEDWHRAMGWNREHVMGPDDWKEIKKYCSNYIGLKNLLKEKVMYLINTRQTNLIGKNIDVPGFEIDNKNYIPAELQNRVKRLINEKQI